MTNQVDPRIISSETISKVVATILMQTVREHKIRNIAFIREDGPLLHYKTTEESDPEDIEDCVCIINLSFLDIRKIEHIFPSSYENLDLAFFYHEMHDNFSEVDIVIDEAYTVLSEQAWDDGPEYYEEDEEDY